MRRLRFDELTPVASERIIGFHYQVPFTVSCYRTSLLPPSELIVSARALLTSTDGRVFAFDSDDGAHVLPGGRRDGEESLMETLEREIREETGCQIVGEPRTIGAIAFAMEAPRPDAYPYPHPVSFHVVFAASAGDIHAKPVDPLVWNGRFVTAQEARALEVPWAERIFLRSVVGDEGVRT